ncbi:MAG: hypothetical protein OES25_13045 [Acidobacteriota bacterium]|nr:hypothetical protein [Acidobacteriota bacterium]
MPALGAPALDGLSERRLEGASSTGRAQAVRQLTGGHSQPNACLTPRIEGLTTSLGTSTPIQGLLGALSHRRPSLSERIRPTNSGVALRYLPDRGRLPGASHPSIDETLTAVAAALDNTLRLLVDQVGLAAPRPVEVILTDLEDVVTGYRAGGSLGRQRQTDLIVLDRSSPGGSSQIARAAAHQMAHQIAASQHPAIQGPWAEALAGWVELTLDAAPAMEIQRLLQHRLNEAGRGLFDADPELVAGNALWLAFLAEAQGAGTVATWLELTAGLPAGEVPAGPTRERYDETLKSRTGLDLAGLLREFHLWSLLTGERSDEHHFSFASSLTAPAFSHQADGLPSVSVRNDPAVAPFGTAQVRLRPEFDEGGMRIRFEGSFEGQWDADLILVQSNGERRRLPFDLQDGTRGDRTLPLQQIESAWLLIRNLGEDSTPQTYTVLAHEEPGFPFELLSVEAVATGSGVDIRWETAAEHQMIGFNLVRRVVGGETTVVVNPVWIPSLGDATHATSYSFFDRGADPDIDYEYRIVGITRDALAVRSGFITVLRDRR